MLRKCSIHVLRHLTEGWSVALRVNHEDLQKKTHELSDALREKTRKHNQVQELYNKLKRKTLYSQVQTAASDAVNQALRTNLHLAAETNNQFEGVPARQVHDLTEEAPSVPANLHSMAGLQGVPQGRRYQEHPNRNAANIEAAAMANRMPAAGLNVTTDRPPSTSMFALRFFLFALLLLIKPRSRSRSHARSA